MSTATRNLSPEAQKWPRITLVTPTFNRVEFLEDCIQSVLSQNYPNLEYIICDGGSTNPAVLDLIRKYEGHLAWWDTKPDRGHAEAIRRGFDNSTGEIMNWLCSDDVLLPGALLAVAGHFNANKKAELVFGNMQMCDATGRLIRHYYPYPLPRPRFFAASNMHQPASWWKRSLYLRAGANVGGLNWENIVYEPNVDLLLRFSKANAVFSYLDLSIVSQRTHAGAVTVASSHEASKASWATFRQHHPIISLKMVYLPLSLARLLIKCLALIFMGHGRALISRRRKTIDQVKGRVF